MLRLFDGDKEVVYGIVKLFLNGVSGRIKDRGVYISFTENSIKWLITKGYDMEFGARPLKRIVQSQVETMIAKKIIAGDLLEGDVAEVYYDKSKHGLNVRKKKIVEDKEKDDKEDKENKEKDNKKDNKKGTSK